MKALIMMCICTAEKSIEEDGAFSIAVDIDKVTAVNIGGVKVELTDEVK